MTEPRRGFTLVEMLTVIALVALVGSLGAGAFQMARRAYSLEGTASRIQGVIRAARNSALTTGSSSFVVVDPSRKKVAAFAFEPVGEWNFDGTGGLALARGGSTAAAGTVQGRVGRALDCRAAGGHVDCGSESRFDLRSTLFIEAWVQHQGFGAVKELPFEQRRRESSKRGRSLRGGGRPRTTLQSTRRRSGTRGGGGSRLGGESTTGGEMPAGAIVSKPGAYFLGMTSSGALEAAIGDFRVRTLERVVPPGRWVYVTLRFDGLELELSADGVPRPFEVAGLSALRSPADGDRMRPPPVVPVTGTPLTISSSRAPFPGYIDEVRLAGSVQPLEYAYSQFEHILGWKKVIRFDRRGHLERRFHAGAVRLVVAELPDAGRDSSTRTAVVVDYSVTFDEWLTRWESPPADLTEAGEIEKLEKRFESEGRIALTVEPLGAVSSSRLED